MIVKQIAVFSGVKIHWDLGISYGMWSLLCFCHHIWSVTNFCKINKWSTGIMQLKYWFRNAISFYRIQLKLKVCRDPPLVFNLRMSEILSSSSAPSDTIIRIDHIQWFWLLRNMIRLYRGSYLFFCSALAMFTWFSAKLDNTKTLKSIIMLLSPFGFRRVNAIVGIIRKAGLACWIKCHCCSQVEAQKETLFD